MSSSAQQHEKTHDSKDEHHTTTTTRNTMLAGALARCGAATIMYPIDVCKTRMQFQRRANSNFRTVYRNTFHCINTMIRTEGFGIYRGLSLRLFYIGPGAAITFTAYEKYRQSAEKARKSGKSVFETGAIMSLLMGAAGRALESGIKTPFNIVKQHLQVEGQLAVQKNRGLVKSVKYIIETKGIRGLFVGYTVTLLRDLPFSFLYFSSYEFIKNKSQHFGIPILKDYTAVRGALAGSFASVITLPFDVIKTRIQTQHKISADSHYSGYRDAVVKIFKHEGFAGFFRGITPRLIYTIPSTSITFYMYEFLKKWFHINTTAADRLKE
ncbi:hypothetical protein C9374_011290 [Naegleria lovaniensis]|uniref:Mitochondrial carrier protein n=1 Tax=Naegleria lovaniensis TaxID=51637 RepID=A0AA88H0F7_NAELO|nr:uncharacterized protein C9374_011290 [Naegleria lovaniensis]KAG2392565.1 hypothetical protein C9374_011290 [Naegleria lovaniensis]